MEIKRKSNFEWLRILAMGMIITLHYMIKGEMIGSPANDTGATNLILTFITFACLPAVNVYVLISGYFLTESTFKLKRILGLLVCVLEYSILITVIMLVSGQIEFSEISIYEWFGYIFPIGTEEYWFMTSYFMLYLLAPFLSAGAKALEEKTLKTIIIVLVILSSVEKTIIPMELPIDRCGYDFGWFLVLFLVAAYIRLYGIKFLEGKSARAWILYIVSVVICWVTCVCGSVFGVSTGVETLTLISGNAWDYNFVFVLSGAVGLFYIFKNASINEDSKLAMIANQIGPMTLGVYLLHEHPLVRYRWQGWLKASPRYSFGIIILNWIMCVIIVFLVGLLTEYVRVSVHKRIDVLRHKDTQ